MKVALFMLLAGSLYAQITVPATTGMVAPMASGAGLPGTVLTCNAAANNLPYLNTLTGQVSVCNGSSWVTSPTGALATCSTAPATEGAVCDNTAAGQLQSFANGILGVIHRTLFQSSATLTYANSTTATSLVPTGAGSMTIPSGYVWTAGRRVQYAGSGVFSTAALAPTLTVCFTVSGTSYCSSAGSLVSSAANNRFTFSITLTCVSITSNVCTGYFNGGALYSPGANMAQMSLDLTNAGSAITWSTTSALPLGLTGTWGTASASNTIKIVDANLTEMY